MLLLQVSAALCIVSTVVAVPKAQPYPQSVDVVEVTDVADGASVADVTGVVIEETVVVETSSGETHHGLKPICPKLNITMDHGCVRYVKGFDVTGVVSEVDLTFPQIQDACDCIQACLDLPGTCAAYVWKFSTPESVMDGHRTCTLYSQFNLPANVSIVIDINNSTNMNINGDEILQNGNNPQNGAPVAQTFMDANLNTTADKDAVSGEVWQLSTGDTIC